MAKKHKVEGNIKPKGTTTRPEYAGEQNMENIKIKKSAGDEYKLDQLKKVLCMKEHRQNFKSAWDEETLRKYVNDYFQYCLDNEITPSRPLLAVWLAVDQKTLLNWQRRDDFFSDIITEALTVMEILYHNDLDNRPVPNMFRLKTSFGYVETNKVEVDTKPSEKLNIDDLEQVVSNLNLS